jgi:hypothetical protein
MDPYDEKIYDGYNEFDAFNAGIVPGGLRSSDEIKVLLCYLLKTVAGPITKKQINDVISGQGLANYFEVNQAMSELLSQGNINCETKGENEFLTVSDIGGQAASELEYDLPRSVRQKAVKALIKAVAIAKNEQENKIDITACKSGYHITFTMYDAKDVMMKLMVFVADEAQAQALKKNFLEDPARVYSGILSSLMVE